MAEVTAEAMKLPEVTRERERESVHQKDGVKEESQLASMPDCSTLDVDERVVSRRVDLGSEDGMRVSEIRSDGTEPL